ncbi:hypothetical protein [Streptomyces sp. A012304]|uniref:hypothetical protein n=1 Tax=Streptomyces sp. A012304 TaxID=375446 RepID=UPI00222FF56D|nr:hypothetical protein [Streptomyces sp. A012304]GKQ34170.1 hypothetical protein ALMP_07210 [Streptomyces sp. A012304]
MALTERLISKIQQEFQGEADTVRSLLESEELRVFGQEDATERVLTAVIIVASGNVDRFLHALRVMEQDWRDLLLYAGLENADWPERLDAYYGDK